MPDLNWGVRCKGITKIPNECLLLLGSVTALVGLFKIRSVVIAAATIVLGLGALFLLFVLLFSQRVARHSCETLRELLHDPFKL